MPRLPSLSLAAAALMLLAACQPPPAQTAPTLPVTAPGLGTGAPAAADQVRVDPIPGLGD